MKGKAVTVKLTAEDVQRLDAITSEREGATMGGLIRAAMRIGLARIERRPSILDKHVLDTRGGPREGSGPKPKRKRGKR